MPLVSVIISTYNSSAFVIETLDSVFNQTWPEIELVITDDCSVDNTVQVCLDWVSNKKQRFQDVQILTSEVNTGVSANANRGFNASKGAWIKFLGADDTLMENCLTDNMDWIGSNRSISVLFSKVNVYKNDFQFENLLSTTEDDSYDPKSIMALDRSSGSQYRMLLLSDRLHYTPSVFIERSALASVKGFDERFRLLEDYPLWLNLTKNGYKLHFMNKETVNYRVHLNAINNTGIKHLVNPNYFRSQRFRQIYTYPFLPVDIRLSQHYYWYVTQLFRPVWANKDRMALRLLHKLLTIYLNPFRYYFWVRKKLNKGLVSSEFYL
jgi:glycosyltransferase involved in cell wall biosynthesis